MSTTDPDDGTSKTADHQIDGVLTAVDVAACNLTATVGTQTIVQHVATAIPITRSGVSIGLAELRTTMQATFVFDRVSEPRELQSIQITP